MPVCANEHMPGMYRYLLSYSIFFPFVAASTVSGGLCMHFARRAVCIMPGYFQTLFALTCAFFSVHILKCLRSNVNPELRVHRLLSLLRTLTLVNQNLLLAEMSATIKVSPIGGVMLLKGFACLLEAGSGNMLGCHMCQPGMRRNSSECP